MNRAPTGWGINVCRGYQCLQPEFVQSHVCLPPCALPYDSLGHSAYWEPGSMHTVIDTPWNTLPHIATLKARGVRTIIRYYNLSNSSSLPEKRVTPEEAQAMGELGISLAVVFQQRGGADGRIADLSAENGTRDAQRAAELALTVGQPDGSAIYFAVDHDYWKPADLQQIKAYFLAVRAALAGKYRVGVYGSGTVARTVRDAGAADLIWLAAAKGWSGTRAMLETDQWALYQVWPPVNDPLPHDGNVISPAWHDYGQFVPFSLAAAAAERPEQEQAPNTVLMEVVARRGLRLRRGPGEQFEPETVLPQGTLVHAMGQSGDWVKVDLQGDGHADGYMHREFLTIVSGGFVAPAVANAAREATVLTPYAVAQAEMALGVAEVPGTGNNPRIVMYHNTTRAYSGTQDSVAWCSSFVNYCVETAGRTGTRSQRALDWAGWGTDSSNDPREGDIVVFERVGQGGHVGFLKADLGSHVRVLGGNQSDRVKLSDYPKDGQQGPFHYKLRTIRRG